MTMFHKAERKKGKLRLAIAGPAGAGKTYSALLIAFGLGGRIALIDTERGSGELYDHLGAYDVCGIEAPFEPRKYIEAIKEAEELGYGIILIDSLSHAWVGQGGLLDVHGHIADKTGNSWAAWRQVTPKHNELVDAMLQSKCHIIATMRSKMEYAQVEENGKKHVKKLGMGPIQRDGMEYEFTVFMDLDHNHTAAATKDRTTLFDGRYFVPTVETGKLLLDWLEKSGGESPVFQPQEEAGEQEKHQSQEVPAKNAPAKTDAEVQGKQQGPGDVRGGSARENVKKEGAQSLQQGGNGDGLKPLIARLALLDIGKEPYQIYCCRRYEIATLTELTPDQIREQAKLLDSLKRPVRLKEFKSFLEQLVSDHTFNTGAPTHSLPAVSGSATAASGAESLQ